jgi:hypothetical protein
VEPSLYIKRSLSQNVSFLTHFDIRCECHNAILLTSFLDDLVIEAGRREPEIQAILLFLLEKLDKG